MKEVDKNHSKKLALLRYTLVISMKGIDKDHVKSLAWTLDVTLRYILVISMKGIDKNHVKLNTWSKLAWVHLQQACMENHDMILIMWLLNKIPCCEPCKTLQVIFNRDIALNTKICSYCCIICNIQYTVYTASKWSKRSSISINGDNVSEVLVRKTTNADMRSSFKNKARWTSHS